VRANEPNEAATTASFADDITKSTNTPETLDEINFDVTAAVAAAFGSHVDISLTIE
jgi:hypothetical protein